MKVEIELHGEEEIVIRGVAYVLNKSEKEVIEEAIKRMIKKHMTKQGDSE